MEGLLTLSDYFRFGRYGIVKVMQDLFWINLRTQEADEVTVQSCLSDLNRVALR